VSALSATAGEFVGPARLRRALRDAGEIQEEGVPRGVPDGATAS
jgi:hypothetical protein